MAQLGNNNSKATFYIWLAKQEKSAQAITFLPLGRKQEDGKEVLLASSCMRSTCQVKKGNENVANFRATKLKSYLYTYLDKNKEKITFFPTRTPLYSADIGRGGERSRKSKEEGRNKSLKLGRKGRKI